MHTELYEKTRASG